MTNSIPGAEVSDSGPARDLTAEDVARVTADDFLALRTNARRYCDAVDFTRYRKRRDRNATVVRGRHALYGTDDVSDDVTQDAVLLFAKRLRQITQTCEISAVWVKSREPAAWQYVRRDGETIIATRATLHRWAVRDAAARNGYRLDVRPSDMDATPDAQFMRALPHADKLPALATAPYLSGHSETIFRAAWADGNDYPTLRWLLHFGGQADDLGRAGVVGKAAQELHGGPRNSSSKVQRTKDAAKKEWQNLTTRLDEVREELVYRSTQPEKRSTQLSE